MAGRTTVDLALALLAAGCRQCDLQSTALVWFQLGEIQRHAADVEEIKENLRGLRDPYHRDTYTGDAMREFLLRELSRHEREIAILRELNAQHGIAACTIAARVAPFHVTTDQFKFKTIADKEEGSKGEES